MQSAPPPTSSSSSAKAELQQFLSTPPPEWKPANVNRHPSPWEVAHASLQALRDSGDERFLFLRTILEIFQTSATTTTTTQQYQQRLSLSGPDEELLFHSIGGCRHVLLSKYTTHSPIFLANIRDYFMVLGHEVSLSRTIRLSCYNTSASVWKRQWNEEGEEGGGEGNNSKLQQPLRPEEQSLLEMIGAQQSVLQNPIPHPLQRKQDLFQYLQGMLLVVVTPSSSAVTAQTSQQLQQQQQEHQMEAGASYLMNLVGEFAGKSPSHYRLALEFHKRAHASFEKDGWLDRSLQMAMKALSQVVTRIQHQEQQQQQQQQQQPPYYSAELEIQVVQVTIDIIGWEFGTEAWDSTSSGGSGNLAHTSGKTMVRPPMAWREILMEPEFVKAVFHVHGIVMRSSSTSQEQQQQQGRWPSKLGHCLRQLLLLLGSLTGPMFRSQEERKVYATYLLEGTLELLSPFVSNVAIAMKNEEMESSSGLLDALSLVSRLIANYKLSILVELPHLLQSLLQSVSSIGRQLLRDNLRDCEAVQGDVESMEHREWREEALVILLEGVVLLCSDPWLLYSNSEDSRHAAQQALAGTLAPLYTEFVTCRTRMARWEEQYLAAHETELDEVREDIYAVDLEDEMESLANVGRLDLVTSLTCLSALFQNLAPSLQSLWDGGGGGSASVVTPEAAGLLEESRLVTLYIGNLLTDDNAGETPVIPDSIILASKRHDAVTTHISGAVQTLLQFAQLQASKIALNPSDLRLSPLLAKSFLWFLNRWAPAYILPVDYGAGSSLSSSSSTSSPNHSILNVWTSPEAVQHSVSFCITLCQHYHCYWPHERQVQDHAAMLLRSLGKRCKAMRSAMVQTPAFVQLVQFHCLTSGIRHSAPLAELESTLRSKLPADTNLSIEMLRGYQRLPYDIKSKILTGLLVGCSEYEDEPAKAMLNDCLKAIHDAFSSLVQVLSTKQASPDHVDAKEMANLCVELYGGVARAGDMVASERIPQFLSPSLPHLSGLMVYYAQDLSICESLLHLFHDYAEQFIAVLDVPSCLVLFQSSAELLKSYSTHHCKASRVVVVATAGAGGGGETDMEEEQNYGDILCAIQLLIQLGTKDFIGIGANDSSSAITDAGSGIDSGQVTDMIFFGLQQILPLMTQGLLQFPTLCGQYFSLVGFMMETYPDKVNGLPYELFDALLESLLFGMSHHDTAVAKSSLQGLAGMIREHLKSNCLDPQIQHHQHQHQNHTTGGRIWFFDKVTRRLLRDVIFQNVIWDRLEVAGMALLPLSAVDLHQFAQVVQELTHHIPSPEHQQRLTMAFQTLLSPDVISKVSSARGYEGRQHRIRFKKDFETFCHEIHSFLVIR